MLAYVDTERKFTSRELAEAGGINHEVAIDFANRMMTCGVFRYYE